MTRTKQNEKAQRGVQRRTCCTALLSQFSSAIAQSDSPGKGHVPRPSEADFDLARGEEGPEAKKKACRSYLAKVVVISTYHMRWRKIRFSPTREVVMRLAWSDPIFGDWREEGGKRVSDERGVSIFDGGAIVDWISSEHETSYLIFLCGLVPHCFHGGIKWKGKKKNNWRRRPLSSRVSRGLFRAQPLAKSISKGCR